MSEEITKEAATAYVNSVRWIDDGYHLYARNLPDNVYEKLSRAMSITLGMGVHADTVGCDKGRKNLYTNRRQCQRCGVQITNVTQEVTNGDVSKL